MERITFEGNFCDISMCRENPCPYNGMCSQRQTWERLKEYEDTGLEPEEIERVVDAYGGGHTLRTESAERLEIVREIKTDRLRELAKAEKDGRLEVLPCKVGDTVYQIDAERVYESEVKWIIFDCDDIAFDERAIGGSIFLTREDAEAALKGGEG